MRGSHHIIAGLAMLGIGRAIVTVGENVDWSQVISSSKVSVMFGDNGDPYGLYSLPLAIRWYDYIW